MSVFYGEDKPIWQVPADGTAGNGQPYAWADYLHASINDGKRVGIAVVQIDATATATSRAEGYIRIEDAVVILGNGEIEFNDKGKFAHAELDVQGRAASGDAAASRVTIDIKNPKRYTIPD